MRYRRFASLLTLGAVLMTCGFPVNAATEEYELWIGGTRITSENKDELPNLLGPDAKGSFDPATGTLYLKDVEGIKNTDPENDYGIAAYIDLTLHIDSDVDIKDGDYIYKNGAYLSKTVKIEGEGTLNTFGTDYGLYTRTLELHDEDITINATSARSIGYEVETINISAGIINSQGAEEGIYANVINSTGGTINAKGENGIALYSYFLKTDLTLDGGIINAEGSSVGLVNAGSSANYALKSGILTAKGADGAIRLHTGDWGPEIDLSDAMKICIPSDGKLALKPYKPKEDEQVYQELYVVDKNDDIADLAEIADRSIVRFVYPGCDIESSQIVLIGSTVSEPQAPDLGGKYVHGWYTDEALTEPFDFSTKISRSMTLYARLETAKPTPIPTVSPTATPTPVATATPSANPTVRVTATPAPSPAATSTPTSTATPTSTPAATVSATPAVTATVTPTDSPSEKARAQIMEFVERIYIYVLDREPEEEGAAFWTSELYSFRRTGAEVGLQFIFSPEFTGRNLSDEDFVTVLYRTFFGRDPESDGFAFWTSALKDGSMDRRTVAEGFIYSQEWADTCASYGIRSGGNLKPTGSITPTALTYAFVERMYTTCMGRGYDEEGRQYWASELANFNVTGEVCGASFFLSDEMTSYGLSDEEFLDRLYLTFMDRESDADGAAYWLGVLASGTPRADVVFGFTRSPEFTDKCIEARILPY